MKRILFILVAFLLFQTGYGQNLPVLKVSKDSSYIVYGNNEPFFWLGGTAWELLHRLTREEVDEYLSDRAQKGFTVIQTVILAELDGLNTPNAYGEKPLIDNDPTKLNEKYLEHVDYVLTKANELGLYVGLLPTWGDKFNRKWGLGPEIFDAGNAAVFGALIAKRFSGHSNLIWILGGDRIPENDKHYAVIRAMASGIREVDTTHLMSYHPVGAHRATDFINDSWLDLDMCQTGHSRTSKEYQYILDAREMRPKRPIINGESRYENIPDRFWEKESYGWLDDADVRISAYWSIMAGAAGYTYGCNDIWQMYDITREPTISARTGWETALQLPGASQMGYMRTFFERFPWQRMVPDQSLVLSDNVENQSYVLAAIDSAKQFALVYIPTGNAVKIDMSGIDAKTVSAFWFNPRNGQMKNIGDFDTKQAHAFSPWSRGRGSDFVLVLVAKGFPVDF